MGENLMTQEQEREYHATHPHERQPNKFAKDGIRLTHKHDHHFSGLNFSELKSIMAQLDYQIEEKKRIAREEEAKKRASKKSKEGVSNG